MNQNPSENQFEQMISQRDKLTNEGEHIEQQQNGAEWCKKMVHNPMSKTTTIIEDTKWNGQNS